MGSVKFFSPMNDEFFTKNWIFCLFFYKFLSNLAKGSIFFDKSFIFQKILCIFNEKQYLFGLKYAKLSRF